MEALLDWGGEQMSLYLGKQLGDLLVITLNKWATSISVIKPKSIVDANFTDNREHGDAIIFGASSLKHMEENLVDLEKGPLPQSVVDALDEAWRIVNSKDVIYYR